MSHVSSKSPLFTEEVENKGTAMYKNARPRHLRHETPIGLAASLGLGSLTTKDEWLTTAEAAGVLKIPEGSLRNLTSNGRIPYYKLGRRNRYLKSDLLKLLLSTRKGEFNGS